MRDQGLVRFPPIAAEAAPTREHGGSLPCAQLTRCGRNLGNKNFNPSILAATARRRIIRHRLV